MNKHIYLILELSIYNLKIFTNTSLEIDSKRKILFLGKSLFEQIFVAILFLNNDFLPFKMIIIYFLLCVWLHFKCKVRKFRTFFYCFLAKFQIKNLKYSLATFGFMFYYFLFINILN